MSSSSSIVLISEFFFFFSSLFLLSLIFILRIFDELRLLEELVLLVLNIEFSLLDFSEDIEEGEDFLFLSLTFFGVSFSLRINSRSSFILMKELVSLFSLFGEFLLLYSLMYFN